MPTTTPIVIRSSSLPSYADCARRTGAKLLWEELAAQGYTFRETSQGVGAALGTSTHEAANFSLSQKIKDGSLGNASEAMDMAFETFHTIQNMEGIVYDSTTPTYDRAELQLKTLVNIYRLKVAPGIQPVEVEIRLEANIGDGYVLSGKFDVRELVTIRDLKTGAASRAHISQYGAYGMLCMAHGRTVESIIEDYLPRKREPEPETYHYDVDVAMNAARGILKGLKRDVAEYRETGDPTSFIANPQSMLCSDRFCPVWGTEFCREHKNKGE